MKYFLVFTIFLVGCMTQKRIEYLQGDNIFHPYKISEGDDKVYKQAEKHTIKPNDELLIKVSSFDDVSFNYFSTQGTVGALQASNELSINNTSFTVDVKGNIYFPVIGEVHIAGLTLDVAREKIQSLLAPYFDQPNVQIKYAYKKISVIGQVNVPGYYTYTKDQITILEAIAMARDLTVHGNRKEVLLIRTEGNDNVFKYNIDLTDDGSVFGYNYYLKPGDVIYVRPRRSIKWNELSTPISIFFSTITTAILVLNAIEK